MGVTHRVMLRLWRARIRRFHRSGNKIAVFGALHGGRKAVASNLKHQGEEEEQ